MKIPFAPLTGLIAAYVLAGLSVASERGAGDEVIATVFKPDKAPAGWMTRAEHDFDFLSGVVILPWVFPVAGMLYLMACRRFGWNPMRIDPGSSPKRMRRIRSTLISHGLWFVCLMVVFFTLHHQAVIEANKTDPVEMPLVWAMGPMVLTLAGVVVGFATLIMRIYPQPASDD